MSAARDTHAAQIDIFEMRLIQLESWLNALSQNPDQQQLQQLRQAIQELRGDMEKAGLLPRLPAWVVPYLQ